MERSPSRAARLPMVLFAGAFLIAMAGVQSLSAAGGGSQGLVRVEVDESQSGDPALYWPARPDLDDRRLAITPDGRETIIFAKKFFGLQPGEDIRVKADMMVSRCKESDFNPDPGRASGCEGTPHYSYAPLIKSQVRIVEEGPDGEPRKDGIELASPDTDHCDAEKHHCILTHFDHRVLTSDDVPATGEARWVVLIAWATNNEARGCGPGNQPNDCDVVDLELKRGRMNVVHVTDPGWVTWTDGTTSMERPADNKLRIASTDAEEQDYRKVVYSFDLTNTSGAGINSLLGDQVETRGVLNVSESRPYDPNITSYLVLADHEGDISGKLISEENGENCDGSCTFLEPGVVIPVSCGDVNAGRRYLNLVAGAANGGAGDSEHVTINTDGELEIQRHYDKAFGPQPPPDPGDC